MIITTHGAAQPGAPGLYGGFPCALNTNVILRGADARERLAHGALVRGESDASFSGRDVLEAKARTNLSVGDMLITRNEGGPGFGDPLTRDPDLVDRDVRTGLCTWADAHLVYGIARRGEGDGHDPQATRERRSAMRRTRLEGAITVTEAIERYGSEGASSGGDR